MLFHLLLKTAIHRGTLVVVDARGRERTYGDGGRPACRIRLHKGAPLYTLALNPSLRFAEAYMNATITFEAGRLEDFFEIVVTNSPRIAGHWLIRTGRLLARQTRWLKQRNPIRRARRNVAHHYDLSGAFYDLFLDRDRQYSCAYFTEPHGDLDRAQDDKKRHIAAKLLLDEPDLKLLDIGSGWGGTGLYLAETAGCDVTGVTLSVEQHKVSRERAARAGLDRRVRFHLRDYRQVEGRYDRIVSVGMFEHVGKRNYGDFFRKLHDLLEDDGVCLLHTIGRYGEPAPINPFIRKYIFPGADVPTLAEVMPPIERSGLIVTDVEILRPHYAETLRLWRERFEANRDKVAELYDQRFCRMWEVYLTGCEAAFRYEELVVFQIQIAKDRNVVPATRDYIHEWERAQAGKQAQAAE